MGDERRLQALFKELSEQQKAREPIVRQLGLKTCARPIAEDYEPDPGATPGAEAGVDFPKPAAPVTDALAEFENIAAGGDCERLRELQHSDDEPLTEEQCKGILAPIRKGFKVLGSEEYGTAAVADLEDPTGGTTTALFVLDSDKRFHLSNLTPNPGSINAPPPDEEQEADGNMEALVAAIRADDVEAFNRVTSEERPPLTGRRIELGGRSVGERPSGEQLIRDVRADRSAKPQRLGINQAYALYALNAAGHYYTLIALHGPTGYKFTGFYPAFRH